ncbi:hypothetical protein N866_07820 [Actinotalea ferrariae CF5-4]|uniref:Uncharacterized protein n=1 Tax=Actinotalea ferrariae CF5-4 TaxID=948458 RepID=A0A021VMY0_9CELL|nr:hypothetical protein [Actinotalea ferrariae]EYR62521.1 hypothetical protein N866_07820 [Actinotalea ferrariae CF5-4]
MHVSLSVPEAVALATAAEPLPPFLRSVDTDDDAVRVTVDLGRMPELPGALRMVASLLGAVEVVARYTGYDDGVATFAVTSRARALPVHTLLNVLTDTVTAQLRRRGLGELVEVRRGDPPVVAVRIQDAVRQRADGVVVQGFEVRDGLVRVDVAVGQVRLRP